MSTQKKVKHLIGGTVFAIVFIVFAFISCKVAVHSSDLDYTDSVPLNRSYGYDRNAYLRDRGSTFVDRTGEIEFDADDYATAGIPLPDLEQFLAAGGKTLTATAAANSSVSSDAAGSSVSTDLAAAVAPVAVEPVATPEPTVEPEPTPAPDTPYTHACANAEAQGLPTPPDVDISEWNLMLVNSTHPLDPVDYAPTLAYLTNTCTDTTIYDYQNGYGCGVDTRIAQALLDFSQACKAEGLPVYLSSGYRSYDEQMALFNRKVSQGYSEDVAKTIVAYPGTSEHQTGLVCDITDYYRETKDSSLEQTATYQWLCAHCAEYGFVVRYPADKSGSADSITGIIYEPWHFRYVGVEAATYMMENNLCLEEFVALYQE